MTSPLSTTELLREVLSTYGVSPARVHAIRAGQANQHWRVAEGDTCYVLRRYHPRRTVTAIQYEHDLLAWAAGKGWPVALPLEKAGGGSIAEVAGARYALFPFLPGRPAPYNNARHLRVKGRLLARVHEDLASWRAPGQRDGFGRLWELDVYVRPRTRFVTFNELLRVFGRSYSDLASAVRAEKYASLRELSRLGYGELPATPVHCDFHHDNLLFRQGQLSALLDFDSVRLDARVADIATSIGLDCLAPPAYNDVDPAAVEAFVGGYVEHTSLAEGELRLVVPLVRAFFLWLTAFRLTQWAENAGEKALRSVQRSVNARFPSLRLHRAELEASLDRAAQGAR